MHLVGFIIRTVSEFLCDNTLYKSYSTLQRQVCLWSETIKLRPCEVGTGCSFRFHKEN